MNLNDAMNWLNNQEKNQEEKKPICYITKEPIVHDIKLKCGHCFEYDAILSHLLATQKTPHYHICPYCRAKHDLFIPYYDSTKVNHIKPSNRIYHNNYITCSHVFTHGKNKGLCCTKNGHKFTHGHFCFQHKNMKRKTNSEICTQILKNGNQCKCKVYDSDTQLCKRHFNIKNKQLKITSL